MAGKKGAIRLQKRRFPEEKESLQDLLREMIAEFGAPSAEEVEWAARVLPDEPSSVNLKR